MAEDLAQLRRLLDQPKEALNLELKQWIDPGTAEGSAKIVKGCLALRNHDGGRLVIGFRDADGLPDTTNVPIDVAATFHPDVIQKLVSKYSSERFEVEVTIVPINGQDYPVIRVPNGVRTPVASISALFDSQNKPLIKDNTIYVRNLNSSGAVSSSEAKKGDWDRLTRICFDNREADIGGFVRRHLAALNLQTLAALVPAFAQMLHQPTNVERIAAELDRGRSQFNTAVSKRQGLVLPNVGYRETIAIIEGDVPPQTANSDFRNRLLRNAPKHSGWPPFIDFQSEGQRLNWAHFFEEGWQALISVVRSQTALNGDDLDFWRIEPRGVFYHLRALEDDLTGAQSTVRPREQLDFLLQIARTAEIMSTCLSFARSLGCKEESTTLLFGFRWTGLEGRVLSCWCDPRWRGIDRMNGHAHQDVYLSQPIAVPLDTPPTGIAPHVENATRGLFNVFDGAEFGADQVEQIVNEAFTRS